MSYTLGLAARTTTVAVLCWNVNQRSRADAAIENAAWSALKSAARRFAPAEAVAACEQIGATLEKLNRDRPARRAPPILDLLLLRALDANETALEQQDEREHVDVPDPKFARRCWRHASAAYGYPMLKGLGLLPGVAPATLNDLAALDRLCVEARVDADVEVVECSFRTNPLGAEGFATPAYFVTAEPGRAVLAIRGTADVGDALTDLVCEAAPFRGGSAHGGILKAAEAVLRDAERSLVVALGRAGPGSELVITGHSMGGGAALLAALSLDGESALGARLRRRGHRVRAVAFGPPPVVSPDVPEGSALLESYCVGDDVVPTASLASVEELLRALDALDATLEVRERMDLIGGHAAASAKAKMLGATGLFPWRAEAARRAARESAEAVRTAVKTALPDGRGPGAQPLVVPGGCLRIGRDGTARRDPVIPVLRVRDGALQDHILPGMETVLEKLCDHADVL
eukprot:CAMPEP_0119289976 /NCGR_PEP_ID=MMETSP1329-20130426/39955_1 /TAXON_ID=114041 /ORGANISM="Genus nov. species nov., Strain RCC1024" /LENGTH=459 /DNA_ID=CAMNT_0007290791 /DNA_START=139 /DNA_END=1515 /DNA_ORIENTATION=-